MQIDGLTQKEIVAAQFDALSRLGDERTYAQDLLYSEVRREHLANVHIEGLESLYKDKPLTEHTKELMRDQALAFIENVYEVQI